MIGIDFGNSKICVAMVQLPDTTISYLDFFSGKSVCEKQNKKKILLPNKLFLEYHNKNILVGDQALNTLEDPKKVALLKRGEAWFISEIKSKIDLDREVSQTILNALFQQVTHKILNLKFDNNFVILAIPPMASKGYRQILRKSIENQGLCFGGFMEDPICLLIASKIFSTAKGSLGFLIIDAGARNLSLTYCHARSLLQNKWEVIIKNYKVFCGLGEIAIEDEMISDLLRDQPDTSDRLLENPSYRESLTNSLNYELGLKDRYAERISENWRMALEEFSSQIKASEGFVDKVIISGGVSTVRRFCEIVEEVWGSDKCLYLDPDTAIAEGAAIYASGLAPDLMIKREYHVGIGLKSGPFFPMILNDEIPKSQGVKSLSFERKGPLRDSCRRYKAFAFKSSAEKPSRFLDVGAYYGLSPENSGNIPLGYVPIELEKTTINQKICFVAELSIENIYGRFTGSLALYDNTLTNLYGSTKLEFPDE